jgi:hypothetical protein
MSTYLVRYNVQDYCKKYPDDPGDQINDQDVVRPQNLKWADQNEQQEWVRDKHLSTHGVPAYGTCAVCWSSGPSYETCAECMKSHYKPLSLWEAIPDSKTFSKKMKKPNQTAKAGGTHTKVGRDMTVFNPHNITPQMLHIFQGQTSGTTSKRWECGIPYK